MEFAYSDEGLPVSMTIEEGGKRFVLPVKRIHGGCAEFTHPLGEVRKVCAKLLDVKVGGRDLIVTFDKGPFEYLIIEGFIATPEGKKEFSYESTLGVKKIHDRRGIGCGKVILKTPLGEVVEERKFVAESGGWFTDGMRTVACGRLTFPVEFFGVYVSRPIIFGVKGDLGSAVLKKGKKEAVSAHTGKVRKVVACEFIGELICAEREIKKD